MVKFTQWYGVLISWGGVVIVNSLIELWYEGNAFSKVDTGRKSIINVKFFPITNPLAVSKATVLLKEIVRP